MNLRFLRGSENFACKSRVAWAQIIQSGAEEGEIFLPNREIDLEEREQSYVRLKCTIHLEHDLELKADERRTLPAERLDFSYRKKTDELPVPARWTLQST